MELQEAIFERRSVRKFTDYYVTDQELKEVLMAARWAPSWANTQCWEFVIVRQRSLIEQVTETYSETNPARKCSFAASALIVACAQTGIAGYKGEEPRTKFGQWFMYDVGSAVQNISLRAHDLGLGTVIVGSMDHDKCKALLELPAEYEVVVVLPIGKPLEFKKNGPARKELKDFVYLNRFKASF